MNFWDYHGILFLIGITLFPRITLLFFTTVTFGLWAWIGFFFAPHLLVAIYASIYYWDSNPILCIIAWGMAFGGTSTEGGIIVSGGGKMLGRSRKSN